MSEGKQIDGELDPLEVEVDRPADRLHQQGLRDPRHAFQKQMPAGEQGDQDPFDHDLLSDHGLRDAGPTVSAKVDPTRRASRVRMVVCDRSCAGRIPGGVRMTVERTRTIDSVQENS